MGAGTLPAIAVGGAVSASERVRLLKFVTIFAVGGTERQVMTLASGLDSTRYELHLACLRRSGELLEQMPIFRTTPPVEYGITKLYNQHAFRERLRFAGYLRQRRIQIVHTYSFYPNVFALPAARLAGTPVILASIRDMGVYLTPLQLRVQRMTCRLAHWIVVNAEAVKRWLVREGYSPDKITVIHNGVDLARFERPAGGARLRHELGLPPTGPLVGMVSRLSPSKGLEDFLRAAAIVASSHDDARFVIVGEAAPRDRGYRESLEALAARLGLASRVVFTGLRHDVPEILAGMAVSVLPSLSEGLSNVILESMAAGVPVVATNVGGNAEAVEDGVTGFVVPTGAPGEVARHVELILSDVALARRQGHAGRRRVAEHFSIEAAVRQTDRLYASLLRDKSHVG